MNDKSVLAGSAILGFVIIVGSIIVWLSECGLEDKHRKDVCAPYAIEIWGDDLIVCAAPDGGHDVKRGK